MFNFQLSIKINLKKFKIEGQNWKVQQHMALDTEIIF